MLNNPILGKKLPILTAEGTSADLLAGKQLIDANGNILTGTMPALAAQTITPGTFNQTISAGRYLSGNQTIKGDPNLISSNIKSGVTIFGVNGSLSASSGYVHKGRSSRAYPSISGSTLSVEVPAQEWSSSLKKNVTVDLSDVTAVQLELSSWGTASDTYKTVGDYYVTYILILNPFASSPYCMTGNISYWGSDGWVPDVDFLRTVSEYNSIMRDQISISKSSRKISFTVGSDGTHTDHLAPYYSCVIYFNIEI